ncbi:DUF3800 domain-containing protein [Ancylobacter radicis]|uniref:DUF3800 domain-containing protein n=1 Tax=Ancylobacter radicis TaxID=2836179 RepID=A0ABS5R7P9_9HYPH|nr:DUF3800 domain-containing protein [Ancylobacter radicis]MBS9477517.1 DUF3800 domain-containing protein [Ancylobacter radicis]
MDEAGTSAKEPVTVVVGLIADADAHVMVAERLVNEILGGVPDQHKDGFTFHAMQVFGDKKYQNGWSITDRLHILKSMMSIPRRVGMAVAVSINFRGAADYSKNPLSKVLNNSQFDHLQAFSICLAVVDRNIRRHAGPNEVATVVAEDIPEMRKFLKSIPHIYRDNPIHIPPDMLRQTDKDKAAGYNLQSGELRITRIRNSVHFVEKSEDPLIQVADACAYGFRRYFATEKFGTDFADAILGDHRIAANFAPPGGCECWWPRK